MKLGNTDTVNPITLVIDGDHLMHRHLYQPGLKKLSNSEGIPTGVTMGVVQQLDALFYRIKNPINSIIFVVGGGSCKWRREIYPDYKFKTPEDKEKFNKVEPGERFSNSQLLSQARTNLKEILPAMGVRYFNYPGYEADEVAYFIIKRLHMIGRDSMAVSDDADWLQLIDLFDIEVHRAIKEDFVSSKNFQEKMGMDPGALVWYQSLLGGHDNIPIVLPKFGKKSIARMLEELDEYSIPAIIEWSSRQTGKIKPKLANDKQYVEQLKTNLKLVDYTYAPLTADIKESVDNLLKSPSSYDRDELMDKFEELEFNRLTEYFQFENFGRLT